YEADPFNKINWTENINPEPITDLTATTDYQIELTWTAPYDPPDPNDPVTAYLVKVATGMSSFNNDFEFMTQGTTYYQSWVPVNPGGLEKHILTGLIPGVTYHISIKTIDEEMQYSAFTTSATFNNVKSGNFIKYWMGASSETTTSISWSDFNNDGYIDFMESVDDNDMVRVHKNNGDGSFTQINIDPGEPAIDAAWGDYDNDGYTDVAIALDNGSGVPSLKIYHNEDGASFSHVFTNTQDLRGQSVAWIDADNDGDLDVFLGGGTGGLGNRMYRNDGGSGFQYISTSIGTAGNLCDAAVADIDEDGDMDIVTAYNNPAHRGLYVLRNEGSFNFTEVELGSGVDYDGVAVGDMDNDGYLDIVSCGSSQLQVWEYTGSSITATNFINHVIQAFVAHRVALGDYDNDGYLDIAMGIEGGESVRLYRSLGSFNFVFDEQLSGIGSKVAWADFDEDDDLDLLVGYDGSLRSNIILKSLHADNTAGNNPNQHPDTPGAPNAYIDFSESVFKFTWTAPAGDETAAAGMYYDVRIGTNPNTSNIVAISKASPLLGNYLRPQLDESTLGLYLHPLIENVTYYAQVRAVDAGLTRSDAWSSSAIYAYAQIPPGKITGLSVQNNGLNSEHEIDLSWIAPGDDGYYETADTYEIKYDTNPLTTWPQVNAASSALPSQIPDPQSPGSLESTTLTGLASYVTYYIAVFARDEVANAGTFTTGYCFTLDITSPTINDNQADTSWLIEDPGAVFDVDFFDEGSGLQQIELEAWTETYQGGTNTIVSTILDFTSTPLVPGVTSYTTEWELNAGDFDNLSEWATNYISLNVFDRAGNREKFSDVFAIFKDTSAPTVDNQQSGDTSWRHQNDGTYQVYFEDTGGSTLSHFQTAVSTGQNRTGIQVEDWTDVETNINAYAYSTDWSLLNNTFDLMEPGTNYISVRVFDYAGSSTTALDVFYVLKDTQPPTINDTQDGDFVWRNSSGTLYSNVTFSDAGGSNLSRFQTKVSTGPSETGLLIHDWTDLETNINLPSHVSGVVLSSTTWTLMRPGTNYISIRVFDYAGSTDTTIDAFYVLKDTITPQYWNKEYPGDDTWITTGRAYDVDFFDYESGLAQAEYTVYSEAGFGGSQVIGWTDIFSSSDIVAYNEDWIVNFNALRDSVTNYVSVRMYDIAYNTFTLTDAFYIKKDTTPPAFVDNQDGDQNWRNESGTLYHVGLNDAGSGLKASGAYSAFTGLGQTGSNPISSNTITFAGLVQGATYYGTPWEIPDFNLLIDEATNYISLEIYDVAGNTSSVTDVFYVLKDTTPPSYTIATPLQNGDTTWLNATTGPARTYDVDFAAAGAELVDAQYEAWTVGFGSGGGGVQKVPLTSIPGVSGLSFTTDWSVDFASLENNTTNFISVEVYDLASNTTTFNAFFVKKDI
ncbi:MAG: hypothetical protein GF384_06630, partial [Elusimicrobia bacterium]|nr:hypothetical protein [Elusimicrobiota bacterium]